MQMFLRSVLALAFLGVFLLAQPGNAETSDDFNTVDLFFYGDLDNGDGNISTMKPTSDKDTQSDCPQDSNRKSFFGNTRQWGEVGSWYVNLGTPGEIAEGKYTFKIWANATTNALTTHATRSAPRRLRWRGTFRCSTSRSVLRLCVRRSRDNL